MWLLGYLEWFLLGCCQDVTMQLFVWLVCSCPGVLGHCSMVFSRFSVQGSLLFVTYTIIQGIIGSEMLVRTGPLNGKCKKEK